MIVFKCNEDVSMEEWYRWKNYIEDCHDKCIPILLPSCIDMINTEEGEEVEIEEE